MQSNQSSEVVVVGAGIIGASMAFFLSKTGAKVTVLESEIPGSGASGHSFAWINAFDKEPRHYHDINSRSLDMWDRFARLLDGDIALHWGGHLTWTSDADEAKKLENLVRRIQSYGYNAHMVDESWMRRLEPGLKPGLVVAAAYTPNEGHVIPTRVAELCLDRVKLNGGRVFYHTKVTDIETVDSDERITIKTSTGEFECDVLVLCAGLGNTELASFVGVDVPQQNSPGVVIRTDPRPPILHSVAAMYCPPNNVGQPEIHIRQDTEGVLMIGEGDQESMALDDSQSHADDLLERAVHYLPELAGAIAIPVPVGYRPMPEPDGLPVVGFIREHPRIYMALMHSGVTLAPLIGELGSLEITSGSRASVLEPYRPERLR